MNYQQGNMTYQQNNSLQQGVHPGAIDPETMERLLSKAQQVGLTLTNEALQALSGLPPEHAAELLEFVLEKSHELRDPSNYVVSTVARGFQSRKSRFGPPNHASSVAASSGTGFSPMSNEVAQGLQRLQEFGIQLDESAKQALSTLPPEHASEMLEYLVENRGNLRSPSNYVSSTVARGFVSRAQRLAAKGGDKGSGKGSAGVNPSIVPADASALERRCLHINGNLASEQRIDFPTYLALRCLPQWQAGEVLDTLEARLGAVGNVCNYVQATVSKIQRGDPASGKGKGDGFGNMPPPSMELNPGLTGGDLKRQRMW